MTRSLWSLVAIVSSLVASSGCKMCEHCLDYDYPAFGGCCNWHADDHCRAGSAFCGHYGHPMHAPGEVIEQGEAVPEPYDAGQRSGGGSVMTPPTEEPPPADLSPPSGRRMRPSGNEPLPRTTTPELPDDTGLPPIEEEPIPDPFDR
jgi:hypothetical protein